MYMIVYDTLVEIFENISRKNMSWNNLYLRESEKSLCVWYLWNLKTCENGEVMSPFTLYGKLKWRGLSRPIVSRESPSVGSALHRWMYETTRCLKHLIALCETWSASGKSEAREVSPPTLVNWRIVWSYVVEVKTLFFPFLRKGKIKVLRGYYESGGPKFVHIGPWACESPNQ